MHFKRNRQSFDDEIGEIVDLTKPIYRPLHTILCWHSANCFIKLPIHRSISSPGTFLASVIWTCINPNRSFNIRISLYIFQIDSTIDFHSCRCTMLMVWHRVSCPFHVSEIRSFSTGLYYRSHLSDNIGICAYRLVIFE
jgi:hypothetical protein